MSYKLDPKILSKLRAFAARRRQLIIIRGVCTAVAMLLATMMLVAALDWLFVLPDAVRLGLSAAAYLAVIVAEWRTCLRLLAHAPGPRRLARLLEHAEPKLREDLLSAVELGTTKESDIFDSPRFRELVQEDVAHRVEGLDVGRLLPVGLVKRYLGIASLILVALVVAFALTGAQLGTLLMRALLPLGNFARVSKFKVEIVEPRNPAQMVIPHGETVPLVIRVSGGRTNKAVLETFTKAGGREVLQMSPLAGDQFSATIQVAREDVEFRVRAGDAITRKYKLDAEPRPHVATFRKTFTFPAYARLAAKKVAEENGDLAALEGSTVELTIETNHRIKTGELRIEQGRKSYALPLTAGQAANQLTATLPLDASGSYRVHLVAADTGFENKFSPEYEIRAEPDLVPTVELETPTTDLLLPANEIVDVQGSATDDLALAKVSQLIRVNEGDWKEFPLATDAGAKVAVERRWDLFEQGVKPGDLLTFKLVAVDLKGSKAESKSVQISITQAGFESRRMETLSLQRQVHEALKLVRDAADALEKQSQETRAKFDQLGEDDPQRRAAAVSAAAAQAEFERLAGEAWTQLTAALRGGEAGHSGADLVLLGRALTRMDQGAAQLGRDALDLVGANPAAPWAREQMHEFSAAATRTAQRARQAEEGQRRFLGSEELDVLNENTQIVAKEQERLAVLAMSSGDDAVKWAQLGNRMRVVMAETRTIEELLTSSADHMEGGYRDRLRHLAKELNTERAKIDVAMTAGAPGPTMLEPTKKLAKLCAETAGELLKVKREHASHPVRVVRELTNEVGPTYSNFGKLREDVRAVEASQKLPAEALPRLTDRRWELRTAHFKTHGDLEEARAASDTYFVSDLRSTTLALQALRDGNREAKIETHDAPLTALDAAMRMLESGHNLAEMVDGLNHLATAERWEILNPRARTSSPRDWEWIEGRLKLVTDELGKAGLDEPAKKLLREAQKLVSAALKDPAAQRVDGEMKERSNPHRVPRAAPEDVEKVAQLVKLALDLLRQPMAEARAQLAALTPKLEKVMAQLAEQAQELKEETAAQAEKTTKEQPEPEAQAGTEQALAKQETLNEKLDSLTDALRADANKQDILEEVGREKARDADDALAMLKEPPARAEAALAEATQTPEAASRKDLLSTAAEQQQKLADSLNQLAEHFENVAKMEAAAVESRVALRAQEQPLGVKEQLDAQYAKAEQMAQLAKASPQELLEQLEKALPQNPLMQQELNAISDSVLAGAEQKLAQAAQQESAVAKGLEQLAQFPDAPKQQKAAAQVAADAAKQAAQSAQKAAQQATAAEKQGEAMGNAALDAQADKAADLAEESAQAAQQAAQAAEQSVNSAAQPPQAMQAAQQAAQKAGEAMQKAQQSGVEAKKAQAMAQAAAQKGGEQQAKNQSAADQAGEAMKAAEQAAQAAQLAQNAAQQAAQAAQAMAQQPAPPPAPAAPPGSPEIQPAANPQLAQAAQQQPAIAKAAQQAGEEVSRAGRHEERLLNMAAGQQLQQLGSEIAETAMAEVPAAQQALAGAPTPAKAQEAVNAASAELAAELGQLQSAASPAQPGAATPGQPQPAGQQPAAQQAKAGQPPPSPTASQPPGAPPAGQPPPTAQPPGEATPAGSPPPAGSQAQAGSPSGVGQPPPTPPGAEGQPLLGQALAAQPGLMQMPLFGAPVSPQEQTWMARTLDALDAALHAAPPNDAAQAAAASPAGQPVPTQPGQPSSASPAPGQPSQDAAAAQAMAQAQSAMSAAAQAAADAMREARGEGAESKTPAGNVARGDAQKKSEGGVKAGGTHVAYAKTADAKNLKAGEWGKLPKKVAEELSQGARESVAGEYRSQVETYYRVIAERAKKP